MFSLRSDVVHLTLMFGITDSGFNLLCPCRFFLNCQSVTALSALRARLPLGAALVVVFWAGHGVSGMLGFASASARRGSRVRAIGHKNVLSKTRVRRLELCWELT